MTDQEAQEIIRAAVVSVGLELREIWSRVSDDGQHETNMWGKLYRIMIHVGETPEESGWHVVGKGFDPSIGALEELPGGLVEALKKVSRASLEAKTEARETRLRELGFEEVSASQKEVNRAIEEIARMPPKD